MNFVSILLYKNVIDKGYAEIFYKMKSFVFSLNNLYIYITKDKSSEIHITESIIIKSSDWEKLLGI